MEEFYTNLSQPSWWLGVVVVGLLLNLTTPYINKVIDKRFDRFMQHRRVQNERESKEFSEALNQISNSATGLLEIKLDAISFSTQAILWIVFTILMAFVCWSILFTIPIIREFSVIVNIIVGSFLFLRPMQQAYFCSRLHNALLENIDNPVKDSD